MTAAGVTHERCKGAGVIEHILQLPAAAIPYRFGQYLAGLHAGRTLVETHFGNLDFMGHAASGASRVTPHAGVYHRFVSHWNEGSKTVDRHPAVFSARIAWDGHDLDLYLLTFDVQQAPLLWIVAATREIGEAYLAAVARWSSELRSEILVFSGGSLSKDEELYRAIKSATFDNLILPPALKDDIRADITSFALDLRRRRGPLFERDDVSARRAARTNDGCACRCGWSFSWRYSRTRPAGIYAAAHHALHHSAPHRLRLDDVPGSVAVTQSSPHSHARTRGLMSRWWLLAGAIVRLSSAPTFARVATPTDAMVAIEGENLRSVTWVKIDEVESGDWGIGGQALTTEAARALAAGKTPVAAG